MSPLIHFLVSIVISIILFPFYKWKVIFVLIGGIFIDVDHYLLYYSWFKKTNFLKAYKYFIKFNRYPEKFLNAFCLFHSIEFLILLVVLSFFFESVFLITIGVTFHYIFDFIFEYKMMKRLIKEWSFFGWLKRWY